MRLFKRKITEIASALYRFILYPFVRIYVEITTNSIMKQNTYMNKGSVLKGHNFLGRNVYLTHTSLGYGSYVAEGSRLIDTEVGKYCSIGPMVSCAFGLHPTKDFVSTHPAFYSASKAEGFTYCDASSFKEEEYVDEEKRIRLEIGNDVWIGAGVIFLEGVSVGDGAIIAAGSLVREDVEPYAIYGGVPAKKIGSRLDEEDSKYVEKSKWWDKSPMELSELVKKGAFISIDSFKRGMNDE